MKELIRRALSGITSQPRNEAELQDVIAARLDAAGIGYEREVPTETGPVDFAVGDVAVEVKIAGGKMEVARQIIRYMQEPRFSSVLLVSTKALHLPIRHVETPQGPKPVDVIELWRNFL